MISFIKMEPINSKNTKIVGSLFLALTIQLSIMVFGISHIVTPFAMSPIIQTVVAQVDQAFKTYDNPKFGLTVPYPPTWSVDELRKDPATASNNSIVAIFKSPAEGQNDKYLENVIVNVQGPRSGIKSLEQYTQNSVKAFNNMNDTIKITQSRSDTLAGLPAHKLEYTSSAFKGLNLKKMQVFTVVNNNTAYVVTYSAEDSQYDKNLPAIEKMIKSIKIDTNAMKNVKENQNQPTGSSQTNLINGHHGVF
jgi:hypothetical protein